MSDIKLGLGTGYFMLSKKSANSTVVYPVPSVAVIHSFNSSTIVESGQHYVQPGWSVFPKIHVRH